jgi:hypothetical protein
LLILIAVIVIILSQTFHSYQGKADWNQMVSTTEK